MGLSSPMHLILLLVVVMLLFGAGRISGLMGDVAKGIKNFKKGMSEEDAAEAAKPAPLIEGKSAADIIAEHEATKAAAIKAAATKDTAA